MREEGDDVYHCRAQFGWVFYVPLFNKLENCGIVDKIWNNTVKLAKIRFEKMKVSAGNGEPELRLLASPLKHIEAQQTDQVRLELLLFPALTNE